MKWLNFFLPLSLLLASCSLLVEFDDDQSLTEKNCNDQLDNDGDDLIDCDDQDCWGETHCPMNNINNVTSPENCTNGIDDDGDDLIDCMDDDCDLHAECMGRYERDCGNGADDDGDGDTDCSDGDCEENPICRDELSKCDVTHNYLVPEWSWHYFRDIYDQASSPSCSSNALICTIKPEHSIIPFCYPRPSGNIVAAYAPCGADIPCGPGLMCTFSEKLSPLFGGQDVCLPFCAPGFHPQCIGGQGLCITYWRDHWYDALSINVEIWLCDRPECDPMNPETSCNTAGHLGRACYPYGMFGDASCHPPGNIAVNGPCTGNDLECAPGHVCRSAEYEGELLCRALCTDSCTDGECIREDPRNHLGICI